MDDIEGTDISWQPPSESEMKIIQARRDRQDKISAITGEYLLKGYKMLSTLCDICGTILLQNKQGVNYCVACSEVDTEEHIKDDPALDNEAAQKKAEEGQYSFLDGIPNPSTSMTFEPSLTLPTPHSFKNDPPNSKVILKSSNVMPITLNDCLPVSNSSFENCFSDSLNVVKQKMEWATQQLNTCQSLNRSIQLCTLLKSCAETLLVLKQIENHSTEANVTNHISAIDQRSLRK